MDGSSVEYECVKVSHGAHHIQLKDCEIRNAPMVGVLEKHSPGDNRYIHLEVHDNGRTDSDHGISLGGSNDVIETCDVYRNAGWGIEIYDEATPCNGTMVRNNRVHDNVRTGTRGAGIALCSGDGHAAINNVVWDNAIVGLAQDLHLSGAGGDGREMMAGRSGHATITAMVGNRFWQLRLMTAVVLMLSASGMLWVNVAEHEGPAYITLDGEEATILIGMFMRGEASAPPPSEVHDYARIRGWPLWFHERYERSPAGEQFERPAPAFSGTGLVVDIVIAFAALLAVALASESILRRREGRKP